MIPMRSWFFLAESVVDEDRDVSIHKMGLYVIGMKIIERLKYLFHEVVLSKRHCNFV